MVRIVAAALVLLALLPSAHALAPLSLDHAGEVDAAHLSYWIDQDQLIGGKPNLGAMEALPWQTADSTPINLGFVDAPVWFHLRLLNSGVEQQQRYLEIANPLLDDVRIYTFIDGILLESSELGDTLPFASRPIRHANFVQPLLIEADADIELLIRVQSTTSLQFPAALWETDDLLSASTVDTLFNGIYYGVLLVILLCNMFAYSKSWEPKYLHYCLYMLSLGLFFSCMNGGGFQFVWPNAPGLTKHLIIISLALTVAFGSLFTNSFLELRGNRPLLYILSMLIAGSGLLIAASSTILPYKLLILPLIALIMPAASLALIAGSLRWYDGHIAAPLFCSAWSVLVIGVLAMSANKLGWIPRSSFSEYAVQLGSMTEFILLSLALIQQIYVERHARFTAQQHALDFERQASYSRQQALMVQQEAARELEERVQQRTIELQVANAKLSAQSITDPLTGLKNRRFFNERLVSEFARSKRDGTPISVIIIDVDHFKPVNDTHGHLLGDEVLKMVAHTIENEARRQCDIVSRHGGEEFSAVLINNSPEQALQMAERIRSGVEQAQYTDEQLSLRCTVSVGVATLTPGKHSSPEELLHQADTALYESKASGRNRVSEFIQRAA